MAVSNRPYLIRALYEWIVDNGWVPHILVDTEMKHVQVPEQYIGEDGNIVLNISPDATRGLLIGNDRIVFTTRFAGISYQVCVPPYAVKAIYAKENGEGMTFPDVDINEFENIDLSKSPDVPEASPTPPKKSRKPHLKVVK
jgi:stringent starvation protein B